MYADTALISIYFIILLILVIYLLLNISLTSIFILLMYNVFNNYISFHVCIHLGPFTLVSNTPPDIVRNETTFTSAIVRTIIHGLW